MILLNIIKNECCQINRGMVNKSRTSPSIYVVTAVAVNALFL